MPKPGAGGAAKPETSAAKPSPPQPSVAQEPGSSDFLGLPKVVWIVSIVIFVVSSAVGYLLHHVTDQMLLAHGLDPSKIDAKPSTGT